MEHINLVTWAVRVSKDKAWGKEVEGGIRVHRVGVLEGDDMNIVLVSQVTLHPLYPKHVGNLQDIEHCTL